ncbi:MAG: hypothetical protein BGO55_11590 [Sphingobacteriales bacterium 50-39]|nr:MAG: hypothetical protein BGO55_11590 [Sphingobacteriales bacterium 50-39]
MLVARPLVTTTSDNSWELGAKDNVQLPGRVDPGLFFLKSDGTEYEQIFLFGKCYSIDATRVRRGSFSGAGYCYTYACEQLAFCRQNSSG